MNYKLIEKLAKLANNNPNEHEANMAARKVCKLLAEGNFKFNESKIISMGTPPSNSSSSIYDNLRDMMNNIRKDEEQYYKQKFYSNPFKTGSYQSPFETGQAGQGKSEQRTYNLKDEKYYAQRRERGFGDTKRQLVCKKCKQIKETIFVGLPEVFECNECIWNKL